MCALLKFYWFVKHFHYWLLVLSLTHTSPMSWPTSPFYFRDSCSPLITFSLFPNRHWLHFVSHFFPSQISTFHCLMWLPIHCVPPFHPRPSFPILIFPASFYPVCLCSCAFLTSGFIIPLLMYIELWVPMANHAGSPVFLSYMEGAISTCA